MRNYSKAQPDECCPAEPQPQHGVCHCRASQVAMVSGERTLPETSPGGRAAETWARERAKERAKEPAEPSMTAKSDSVTTGPP